MLPARKYMQVIAMFIRRDIVRTRLLTLVKPYRSEPEKNELLDHFPLFRLSAQQGLLGATTDDVDYMLGRFGCVSAWGFDADRRGVPKPKDGRDHGGDRNDWR
jgi:hypothetical protein